MYLCKMNLKYFILLTTNRNIREKNKKSFCGKKPTTK